MSKSSNKNDTWGEDRSSTWKLKSPVKMSLDEDEMKSSRSEVNSDMKVAFEDDGGR